jgi:hypothetical protein
MLTLTGISKARARVDFLGSDVASGLLALLFAVIITRQIYGWSEVSKSVQPKDLVIVVSTLALAKGKWSLTPVRHHGGEQSLMLLLGLQLLGMAGLFGGVFLQVRAMKGTVGVSFYWWIGAALFSVVVILLCMWQVGMEVKPTPEASTDVSQ